jgi:hypothetical protein
MRRLPEGNFRAEDFRGAGVPPAIFLNFTQRNNGGETPAPLGQASLPT